MYFGDRVKDTTTTTGTGTITLSGTAPTGFQAFATHCPVGQDRIPYAIVAQSGGEWETGSGTLLTSTTLRRDIVFESSNGDALVNFSAGTKDVFITIPSDWASRVITRGRGYARLLGADMP